MQLSGLPSENILKIAETLSEKDLNSLLRSSRSMANLLLPSLHALAIQDKDGLPALIWATKTGHEPLATLLLSKGASPNCRDPTGMTPLCWSAWTGRTDLTKLLLSHGAQINTPDDQFRMTPLIWAANMEHPSTCDLLVSAGADLSASDHRGETILHWAAKRGFCRLVLQLIEEAGMSVDTRENYGNTPLHCAVFFGQEDTARLLLRAGANPNARNSVGMTALHWAAGHRDGFAGIICCLLEYSADPEIPDGSGRKAVYRARMYENVSSVMLLQEGHGNRGGNRQCSQSLGIYPC